jgi:hypothetical protein
VALSHDRLQTSRLWSGRSLVLPTPTAAALARTAKVPTYMQLIREKRQPRGDPCKIMVTATVAKSFNVRGEQNDARADLFGSIALINLVSQA